MREVHLCQSETQVRQRKKHARQTQAQGLGVYRSIGALHPGLRGPEQGQRDGIEQQQAHQPNHTAFDKHIKPLVVRMAVVQDRRGSLPFFHTQTLLLGVSRLAPARQRLFQPHVPGQFPMGQPVAHGVVGLTVLDKPRHLITRQAPALLQVRGLVPQQGHHHGQQAKYGIDESMVRHIAINQPQQRNHAQDQGDPAATRLRKQGAQDAQEDAGQHQRRAAPAPALMENRPLNPADEPKQPGHVSVLNDTTAALVGRVVPGSFVPQHKYVVGGPQPTEGGTHRNAPKQPSPLGGVQKGNRNACQRQHIAERLVQRRQPTVKVGAKNPHGTHHRKHQGQPDGRSIAQTLLGP